MVENRPLLTALSHGVLILGVVAVAFPLYVTFVASTLTLEQIMSVPMPLLPGDQLVANYTQVLTAGSAAASEFDGKWPPSVHIVTCCSLFDSHSTSAMAAALLAAFSGTPSHEPPQLVAPPGSTGAMSHLPA